VAQRAAPMRAYPAGDALAPRGRHPARFGNVCSIDVYPDTCSR